MSVEVTYLASDNPWVAHKTWRRIGAEKLRSSVLHNQYALQEYGLSPQEAELYFRIWLWEEMQDEYNGVWRELSELATADQQEEEVEIRVLEGQSHGECIARAIQWMQAHTQEVELPALSGKGSGSLFPETEDGVFTVDAQETGVDERFIVWVTGRTQSRMGVIHGKDQVLVPEYGVVPCRSVRWADKALANAPYVQDTLGQLLDETFAQEMASTPAYYNAEPYPYNDERFETAFEDVDTEEAYTDSWDETQAVLDVIDQEGYGVGEDGYEEEVAYWKRPPRTTHTFYDDEVIQPAYLHTGGDSFLMILTPEEYAQGKRFRYATKEETEEYLRMHRRPVAEKPEPTVVFQNTLTEHVRTLCRQKNRLWR